MNSPCDQISTDNDSPLRTKRSKEGLFHGELFFSQIMQLSIFSNELSLESSLKLLDPGLVLVENDTHYVIYINERSFSNRQKLKVSDGSFFTYLLLLNSDLHPALQLDKNNIENDKYYTQFTTIFLNEEIENLRRKQLG